MESEKKDLVAAPGEPWRRAVAEFVERARAALGDKIVRVVLFGSRARGDYEPDSDIDLIVFVSEGTDARAAYDVVSPIASDVWHKYDDAFFIQVHVYTQSSFQRDASYFLIKNVKAEGVEV